MGIIAKNIIKEFGKQRVLHNISLSISDGDYLSISGRSGSGKSTLLYILSTLDLPNQGSLFIDEIDIQKAQEDTINTFRGHHIGFIFQFHYLLPELSALDNVLLPARNYGIHEKKKEKALHLLEELEVSDQAYKLPSQMSGGQMQRVAIARALIMEPKYIFADEPTGNLDTYNSNKVMSILQKINDEQKTTIVLVTHDPEFSAQAKSEIFLIDGKISP